MQSNHPDLLLGTSQVEITPQVPLRLAGFAERVGSFEGVRRPLFAKISWFEQTQPMRSQIIMIHADLIWWSNALAAEVKKICFQDYGVPEKNVIVHASHTHSGPQTSEDFTTSVGQVNVEYITFLFEQLKIGLAEAKRTVTPVQISHGIGKATFGLHRRKWVDGVMTMAPNPDGPKDDQVHVFRYASVANPDQTIALMTHFTCHPTTALENQVSSEYPGAAMEFLQNELGSSVVCTFLQGCCGDIRPAMIENEKFYRGDDEDVKRLGEKLAHAVLQVLEQPMIDLVIEPLYASSQTIHLNMGPIPTNDELKVRLMDSGITAKWSQFMLNHPERLRSTTPFQLSFIKIAAGLSFVTFNGEVVSEYGLWLKKYTDGNTLPLPYSNGMIGYIPTAEQVNEGGYEGKDAAYIFGLPAPYFPDVETTIKEAIINLLNS